MYLVISLVVNALALFITQLVVTGINFDSVISLFVSAVVVSIVNTFIRPFAQLISLPITVLTLGIFALVVNAGMLALAAWVVPGFHIDGFWAAFWGSILLSIVSTILSWISKPKPAE